MSVDKFSKLCCPFMFLCDTVFDLSFHNKNFSSFYSTPKKESRGTIHFLYIFQLLVSLFIIYLLQINDSVRECLLSHVHNKRLYYIFFILLDIWFITFSFVNTVLYLSCAHISITHIIVTALGISIQAWPKAWVHLSEVGCSVEWK